MASEAPWQDEYITELVELLARIAKVVDGYPEIWADLERAGISVSALSR